MAALSPDVTAALATLRTKWGAAAPARAGEVVGALATAPLPDAPGIERDADRAKVFSTGFRDLDAILASGGLPRGMGLSLRGDLSSGRTTLALRLAATAQAAGSIVAWLDLAEAFDPVEAVSRGIRPEWLVVVTPRDLEEGIAIAGSLLAGRAVDLLVVDLPARPASPARAGDRLGRLAALARRAGISIVVLEPPGLAESLRGAIGEATGIRLELARRSWIRLGRDVVGQRTEAMIARNRAGPPGRRATLRILYAEGGERDACLRDAALLIERDERRERSASPAAIHLAPVIPVPGNRNHATAAPLSPAPPPRPREATPALRLMAGGAGGARREAVDGRDRPGRGLRGTGARGPARDPARGRASARA